MPSDLRSLLYEAATVPRRPLDLDRVLARGRRRRRARRLGLGAGSLALAGVVMSVVAVPGTGPDRPPPQPPTVPSARPVPFTGLPPGWTELPAPPQMRHHGATAWTGDQLLVWGGAVPRESSVPESDGFVFDTRSGRWEPMATSPLAARVQPAAAWTGTELLVWGGAGEGGSAAKQFGDGAAYDPRRGTWRPLPPAPIGGRTPLSVWTGDELIVWGTAVRVIGDIPVDGAAYRPATDSWRRIADVPIELTDATAVWTGRETMVVGAKLNGNNVPATRTAVGAAYDPAIDRWRRLPDWTLSPQASTAAWAGGQLIAWDYNTAAAGYDPARNQWRSLPGVPLQPSECYPRSVAVGHQVFGEFCGAMVVYDADSTSWRNVTRTELADMGFELVPAGPVVALLGWEASSGIQRMLVYRPNS